MARSIGLKHRVKRTKEGEARPTMVAVIDGDQTRELKLETEDDEIDFVLGQFPIEWRNPESDEELSQFLGRHIKGKRDKKTGEIIANPKVPSRYDGLQASDTVAMSLGGSGDYLAYAIARQFEKLGSGSIVRISPGLLKERRVEDKANDHFLVAQLVQTEPSVFHSVTVEDLKLIELNMDFRARQDALKARIACEQRLFQRTVGTTFVREGLSPESSIKDRYREWKANDRIMQALLEEEAARDRELEKSVHHVAVWEGIFAPIEGIGPRIAAPIIVAVGNILTFPRNRRKGMPALKKMLGVACTPDGEFMRFRAGESAGFVPEARQALWLLGEQFNRRPDSFWGQKLREYKRKFREKYPEPVLVQKTDSKTGKSKMVKCYTDGHIHKRALWRTVTKFVEYLYREWKQLAEANAQSVSQERVA